jgi:hypothetical protein
MVTEDVYKIGLESTGSGRFLENLPAQYFSSYLAIDKVDGSLGAKLQTTIEHLKDVDTIIAVDTGGDSLYKAENDESSAFKTTPEQDLRVLETLNNLKLQNIKLLSSVIAVGIDSPDYASEILESSHAAYHSPTEAEAEFIQKTYQDWDFQGGNKDRYGKTPFAWQASLRGNSGQVLIPLPTHLVFSETNPWNPFVNVTVTTKEIFLMELGAHVASLKK